MAVHAAVADHEPGGEPETNRRDVHCGGEDRPARPHAARHRRHDENVSVLRRGRVAHPLAALRRLTRSEAGMSLVELAVSAGVTSIVSGIIVSGMLRLSSTHTTMSNRTDLHAGVRGATELMQHEISQAGRLGLPGPTSLAAPVVVPGQ